MVKKISKNNSLGRLVLFNPPHTLFMADLSENYDFQLNFWSVVIFHAARSMIFSIKNIHKTENIRKFIEHIIKTRADTWRHFLSRKWNFKCYIHNIYYNRCSVYTIFTQNKTACVRNRYWPLLQARGRKLPIQRRPHYKLICLKFKEQNKQAISRRDRSKYCDFFFNCHLNDCDRKWSVSWQGTIRKTISTLL